MSIILGSVLKTDLAPFDLFLGGEKRRIMGSCRGLLVYSLNMMAVIWCPFDHRDYEEVKGEWQTARKAICCSFYYRTKAFRKFLWVTFSKLEY